MTSFKAADFDPSGAIQWLWETPVGTPGSKTQYEPILEDPLCLHHILLRRGCIYKTLHVSFPRIADTTVIYKADDDLTSSLTFYRRIFPVTEIRIWLYIGYGLVASYAIATLCSTTFQW